MNAFLAEVDTWGALLVGLPFLLLPIEIWRLYRARQLNRRTWFEIAANISPLVPTLLAAGVTAAYITWIYGNAAAFAPWSIPVNGWTLGAAILLVDFTYYWDHRIGHRVRIAWALYHSVHHSSPLFNQTTAVRISFLDGFVVPWFYVPIVLAYQQWIHTETITKLGWFDAVFNSPSNHRVHHATQPEYIDKNYGGILIIWDRLFGTYQSEGETPVYGLTEQINSASPIDVHFAEARRLAAGLRRLKTWKTRIGYMLEGPEVRARDQGGEA